MALNPSLNKKTKIRIINTRAITPLTAKKYLIKPSLMRVDFFIFFPKEDSTGLSEFGVSRIFVCVSANFLLKP